MGDGIRHVSDTAFLIAQCRAVESARPDALFHDPLAARLAGDKGRAVLEAWPRPAMTGWMTAVRTVVIDDFIAREVARGVTTVVNLGAGLDTRPFRMHLPASLEWIEVDYPGLLDYKTAHLQDVQPRCHLTRIPADLADATTRTDFLATLDTPGRRTLVLTEGVIPYLDNQQVAALAADLRRINGVTGWIVDYMSPASHRHREKGGITKHMRNAPFRFRPDDWFGFFGTRGWRVRDIRYLPVEGARLGRPAPLPLTARLLMWLARRFGPAGQASGLTNFAGFAILE